MYDQFRWTNVSARRNALTIEYEPIQPFFLLALAETAACGTFLDVGANIGAYSLFATLVPTVKKIVAFEANRETAEELKRNLRLNRLDDRVELVGKAVSNTHGQVTFGIISRYSGANSVVETTIHARSTFHKEVIVDAITLDGMFPEPLSAPLCLKIDVEGHEKEVIEGGKAMLSANQAVVQLEGYEHAEGSSAQALAALGYSRLTRIGPDRYFSNIDRLRASTKVVEIYERALGDMIASNHRNKAILLKRGDVGIQLTGKVANLARSVAKRLIGRQL